MLSLEDIIVDARIDFSSYEKLSMKNWIVSFYGLSLSKYIQVDLIYDTNYYWSYWGQTYSIFYPR